MNNIKMWRENAFLTQEKMAYILEIPKRTIENWESGIRKPPVYVEKLVIEKLMNLTEKTLVERAIKYANSLKSDENGNRPVGSWAVITKSYCDEFVELYKDMNEAIYNVEDGYVTYVLCNKTDKGLEPFYIDKNNNVHPDHDIVKLS